VGRIFENRSLAFKGYLSFIRLALS